MGAEQPKRPAHTRYVFDLMQRAAAVVRGYHPDKPITATTQGTFVRVPIDANSDVEALVMLRDRYPECAWRLVGLYEIEPAP